ncbi:MAG: polysaccharide ABC transporter ATP-binding protein [bacterium]|nr:polysaccharide ABC transporter ATP-binding protein [bacterium]
MSKYALEIKNVSKSFRLPTEQSNGIKQAFINWTKGVKGYKEHQVLKDISFKVEKGDFFGIVGRNGSGKSTLLKIISQIYTPEKGEVKVNGKLIPFIELGVGFNPELTGRENIYLNGALLGFSHEEISEMYDEIVEFAELEEFMDQKLKNYSSGMQVRLAFSIAIKAQGDILVLDEVLAVGDEAFQRKCFSYFAKLKKEKKTVILVTHSMDSVQQFCNKAVLIDKKSDLVVGSPSEIAQIYRKLNNENIGETESSKTINNSDVSISCDTHKTDSKISFSIDFSAKKIINDAVLTFMIIRDSGEIVYRYVTDEKMKEKIAISEKPVNLSLEIDNIFPNGYFSVQVGVKSRDRSKVYSVVDDISVFEVVNQGSYSNDVFWKPKSTIKLKK